MSLVRVHPVIGIVAIAAISALTPVLIEAANPPAYDAAGCLDNNIEFYSGSGCWVYHDDGDNHDKPVRVHYYYPPNYSSGSTQVVFAMHGSSRDSEEVLERWRQYADIYGALVVAPEFSKEHYPKGRNYNRGNVRDNNGRIRDKTNWTFMTIEEIFDLVRQEILDAPDAYSIHGHSAGAQFVQRLVLVLPEARIETAVPAGAGWYLLPDETTRYPCGISNVGILDDDLEMSYAKNLVLTLGTFDDDPNAPGLNHDDCAEAQGAHRYERGHFFFAYAEDDASSRGHTFNWTVVDAPGVGHSTDDIVEYGVEAIFENASPPSATTLPPVQDTVVKASYPNSNYGRRDNLQVDGRSVKTTYMQFDLQGIQAVSSAMLELKITDSSDGVQYVKEVEDNNWSEDTLTYNNRPIPANAITSVDGGSSGTWLSIDLSNFVRANMGGLISISLESPDSDGLYFKSKESTTDAPELVVYD